MILGNKIKPAFTDYVYVIILLGQSNAVGNGEVVRLANSDFNYKGIATGYPTVRSSQSQYVTNPTGVYIYNKGQDQTVDFSVDNGAWEVYVAGTNSGTTNYSNTLNKFGIELSLAQNIYDNTGREVFIIKPAWGGTSLVPSTSSLLPGNWNNTSRTIASQFYIDRAMRDLKIFRPSKRSKLLTVLWWQGETDGSNGVSKTTYKSEFYKLRNYITFTINKNFALSYSYQWNIFKLNFNNNAAETIINDALTEIVSESSYNLIITSSYPQKVNLTTQEASPLTKGSPNAQGGLDDTHSSYITLLSGGELIYQNIIGLL